MASPALAKVLRFDLMAHDGTRVAFESVKRNARDTSNVVNSTLGRIGTFAAGFVSIAAVRSVGQLGKAAIDSADEVATAASRIGIAADEFQRFRFAAEQADVGTKELDGALRVFAQNLSSGEISAQGRDLAESFRNYIEQIADAPSHLEKVALAQKAFGRQWQSAMLLAAQGADEFQKQADSAFVFSTKALAVAGEFDNQFRSIHNAVELGFGTGFIEAFSGSLTTTQEDLAQLNQAAETFGRSAATAFKAATLAVSELGDEMAEMHRQTAAYVDAVTQWQEGNMGLGDLAGVLMDPREHMRKMSGIQQSSDWWGGGDQPSSGFGSDIQVPLGSAGGRGRAAAVDPAAKVLESLRFEREQLARTNEEQAIYNRLKQAGVGINSEVGVMIAQETRALYQEQEAQKALSEQVSFFGETAVDAFDRLIIQGQDYKDVLDDLAGMMLKLVLQAALLGGGPFAGPLGTASTGAGEGGLVGALGSLLGGSRAGGGPVEPGRIYQVHKDEWIIPREAGSVVPMRGGMSGGSPVSVNVNVINNNGSSVETSSRQNENGGIDLEVMIGNAVAKQTAQPGSSMNRQLGSMGVRTPPVRR
ncbi:hypothetical protein [Methyloceanibacter sp.]|uniref:hypothetical protein n=1 Tax=Methyloceanibacter sp. TaxID=1965321 RepID=UPI002C2DDACA|nr:hypothetical protein [Methyloceanibacter sp.]HML93245.1 hypothetical protein [Methyloceanibacter sp.]